MRLNFKFTNLFGTAYKSGQLVFTLNGCGLLVPVGNQITIYDLKRDETLTIAANSFHDIQHIAVSPSVSMLLACNKVGEISIISLITGAVVSVYPMRHPVSALRFSPDGSYVAVAKGHCIMMFFSPSDVRQFNHLELFSVFYGFCDNITCIDWSDNSRFFIAGSVDNSTKVFSLKKSPSLTVYTLSGHKNPVVGSFFMQDTLDSVTISCDGDVRVWEANKSISDAISSNDTKVAFRLHKRFRYHSAGFSGQQALITATAFQKHLSLLVAGFDSGTIMLHTLPDFTVISEVKLFKYPVSSLSINHKGDLIAAASEEHGELAVWEWRSEICYLKAESHSRQMTSVCYSPDGLHLATGGSDTKVKVWRVAGGRALVTFSEHTAAVTGVAFPQLKPKVVVSASLDGTVRAHDLVRYRNFRTLTVPTRAVQLASLAVDAHGSIVAAGGLDTFDAYVWSVKTGLLLTCLSGHTAPISGIAFNPDISGYCIELGSGSWDGTLRLWDLSGNSSDADNMASVGGVKEVVHFHHDVLCIAYRGDGKQVALALINGSIVFYDPVEGTEHGTIYGQHDLGVSQTLGEALVTPKRSAEARRFQTMDYSADGEHLLAAGSSKYICLYSIPDKLLLKRFEVTCNMSLSGVQEVHDRRRFLASYSVETTISKALDQSSLPIPRQKDGVDKSRRHWRPEITVSSVHFAPTGDAFAATSTEGVLVYSLSDSGTAPLNCFSGNSGCQPMDAGWLFEANQLDEATTPEATREALARGDHAEALDMAVRLRLPDLVEEVVEAVPVYQIDYLARQMPTHQVANYFINFLSRQLAGRYGDVSSRHVEFYVHWAAAVLHAHAMPLRRSTASLGAVVSYHHAIQRQSDRVTGGADRASLDEKTQAPQPAFTMHHTEWALCQASLVRLLSSLQHVKDNLIQRLESVDNLWNYLSSIPHSTTSTKWQQPTPLLPSDDQPAAMHVDRTPTSQKNVVTDADELSQSIATLLASVRSGENVDLDSIPVSEPEEMLVELSSDSDAIQLVSPVKSE